MRVLAQKLRMQRENKQLKFEMPHFARWLGQKDKIVGDRYDFVTIYSVKDVLDQLGLVQKIMYQLFPPFRAILP
jgi:hypothetical protein